MASTADRDEPAAASSELAARPSTRVMGIETEYGISALAPGPSAPPGGFGNAFMEDDLHPMQLSNHVVKAYGGRIAIVGDPKDHSTRDLLARIERST